MKPLHLAIFLAVAVAAIVAVVVLCLSGEAPLTGPSPQAIEVTRLDGADMFCGLSLQLHEADETHPYDGCIDQIAAAGANTVCLVVPVYQENCASTSLFIDARKGPTDQRLAELIAHAHQQGLKVVLMPIVLLDNPRPKDWRGRIKPHDWDAWWENYTDIIVHYARLAQQAEVDVYIVGSELLSTERETGRWRDLIGIVRYEYKGLLSYSTNWDHYQAPKFWDDLDLIGMTTYFDLTSGEAPELPRLQEAWETIRRDILDWQATVGRPILFTEVGWPNQVGCAEHPWDYVTNRDEPDPVAQEYCFEAFFRTWINEPAVGGIMIWEWKQRPTDTIDETDTSYIPCGKRAMDVISHYFRAVQGLDDPPTASPAETPDPAAP